MGSPARVEYHDHRSDSDRLDPGGQSAAPGGGSSQRSGSALVWLLVVVLLGVLGYGYIRREIDPRIAAEVLEALRQRYPKHLVSLRSARLIDGGQILLSDLQISAPGVDGPRPIVAIERIKIFGRFDLSSLTADVPPIDRVVVEDCDVRVWPLDESSQSAFSVETLFDSGPLPPWLPPIEMTGGTLHLLASPHVEADELEGNFRLRCRRNEADPQLADRPYELQIVFSNRDVESCTAYVSVDRSKQHWQASGQLRGGTFRTELLDRLPPRVAAMLAQLRGFDGTIDGEYRLEHTPGQPTQFVTSGKIRDGQLLHPKLPYPLRRLSGSVYCRNNLLQLRGATASSDEASFQLDADIHGTAAAVPIVAQLHVDHLAFDKRLYDALPEKPRAIWRSLKPAGAADADIRFEYDGRRWRSQIDMRLLGAAATYEKFPLPITGLTGRIRIDGERLWAEGLSGVAAGAPVRFERLEVDAAADGTLYDVQLSAAAPIKIDEPLLSALSPAGQPIHPRERFIRSLALDGLVQVRSARFHNLPDVGDDRTIPPPKNDGNSGAVRLEAHHAIELEFIKCELAFEHFRYPIFGIDGRVSIDDGMVRLQDLKGRNDSAAILCQGVCDHSRKDDWTLDLTFIAAEVPLEEELRAALPQGTRQLWDAVQPTGVLDSVAVRLSGGEAAGVSVAVTIDEQPATGQPAASSVTLRPREIPYTLSDIGCRIEYANGVATIRKFSVQHDVSRGIAEGQFSLLDDGTWQGSVQWLPSTRLVVDQSLLTALPQYLQRPILSTAFRGPVGITGRTNFRSRTDGRILMDGWDLQLAIEEGRLGWGEIAENIRGSAEVVGRYDGTHLQAEGQLQLDSLLVYGVPILNVFGPFYMTGEQIWLGRSIHDAKRSEKAGVIQGVSLTRATAELSPPDQLTAPPQTAGTQTPQLSWHDDDIAADCLGGQLRLSGAYDIGSARTQLTCQLHAADLSEAVLDLGHDAGGLSGKIYGECQLAGVLGNPRTFTGGGVAWLRDAGLVHLPVMERISRKLGVKNGDAGIIESGEAVFRIDGDWLPVERISLDGDLVSLRGSGWINLRREVQLDLYAYVGKRSILGTVFGPIIADNDNASLLAIQVGGLLEAMEVRQSLPLMEATAGKLFPDRTAP